MGYIVIFCKPQPGFCHCFWYFQYTYQRLPWGSYIQFLFSLFFSCYIFVIKVRTLDLEDTFYCYLATMIVYLNKAFLPPQSSLLTSCCFILCFPSYNSLDKYISNMQHYSRFSRLNSIAWQFTIIFNNKLLLLFCQNCCFLLKVF